MSGFGYEFGLFCLAMPKASCLQINNWGTDGFKSSTRDEDCVRVHLPWQVDLDRGPCVLEIGGFIHRAMTTSAHKDHGGVV